MNDVQLSNLPPPKSVPQDSVRVRKYSSVRPYEIIGASVRIGFGYNRNLLREANKGFIYLRHKKV